MFNIDIIREHGTRDHFYVIDINYFPGKQLHQIYTIPTSSNMISKLKSLLFSYTLNSYGTGYGKMPGYEHIFTDFLLRLGSKQV